MRTISIMIRILRQLKRDKRTVALMILVPIFVLSLLSFIFNGSDYNPKIGVVNVPNSFTNKLEEQDAKVFRYNEYDAYAALRSSEVDAIITFEHGILKVQLEGSDSNKNKAVITLVQAVNQPSVSIVQPEITYFYGYEDMSSFDNFGLF